MANPILNERTFEENSYGSYEMIEPMTKQGVVTKSAGLLLLVIIAAALSWYKVSVAPQTASVLAIVGAAGGFITALIIAFKRDLVAYLAPVYALLEGLFIGVFSCYFEAQLPGIVLQAVLGTFAVLFTVLALYVSGVVVVTQRVRNTIIAATLAVAVVYLVAFIGSFLGLRIPFLYDASGTGIAVSIIITLIAAANFLIDFDNIDKGIQYNAPKIYEWYCAFGLLVTLIWVYIEILKLLAKFSRRR